MAGNARRGPRSHLASSQHSDAASIKRHLPPDHLRRVINTHLFASGIPSDASPLSGYVKLVPTYHGLCLNQKFSDH